MKNIEKKINKRLMYLFNGNYFIAIGQRNAKSFIVTIFRDDKTILRTFNLFLNDDRSFFKIVLNTIFDTEKVNSRKEAKEEIKRKITDLLFDPIL